MVDIRLPASGNIRMWFGPENAFSNWRSPTATEINAILDISDAVSWNDFDFGVQASNTQDDPAITAKGNVQTRGAGQYGGSLSFYYPKLFNDASNKFSTVFEALKTPGTVGYLVMRVDGEELLTTASTSAQPGTIANVNDFVHVFKVQTDGWTQEVVGDDAFRYTISFLSKGQMAPYTLVRTTAATVVVAPSTATVAIGAKAALTGTVLGRPYTQGLVWTSANPANVAVSANGVVTRIAAGSTVVTATFANTGASATATIS